MLTAAQFQQWCLRLGLAPATIQLLARCCAAPPISQGRSQAQNVLGPYASRKMGCTIQFESHKGELWAIYRMEYDPRVLECYDQPLTLELHYVTKAGQHKTVLHTPDFLVLTSEGAWLEEWKHLGTLQAHCQVARATATP